MRVHNSQEEWQAATGGPAFPMIADNGLGHVSTGMTLRDWFATHAPKEVNFPSSAEAAEFVGIPVPAAGDIEANMALSAAISAKISYAWADAMLAERSK